MEYIGLFEQLKNVYGKNAKIVDEVLYLSEGVYFEKVKEAMVTDRFGEVVFAVIRPSGKIILIRSEEYPDGVFRVPTGGIHYGEDIIDSLYREVAEELGLQVAIREFAGMIHIRFRAGSEERQFYSFVFLLDETGGRLLEDALEDEVCEVLEADQAGMERALERLKTFGDDIYWAEWGKFRYLTTAAAMHALYKDC